MTERTTYFVKLVQALRYVLFPEQHEQQWAPVETSNNHRNVVSEAV